MSVLSPFHLALAWSCAVPALLCAPALAQQTTTPFEGTPRGTSTTLDAITVSATGLPTPQEATGSSVTVLTAETLEAQQRRTVPDALQQVPGINVVQTGGPGGQTSVFIRGAESRHTKVFIDGIEANDPSNPNGSFDFGQLVTDDLARIEVLRGPQSGLYGADAVGGVVSFITKRGEGPARAVVRVEGGSFGTFNQFGRVSGSDGAFDYSLSVSHLRAAATPVTPRDLSPFVTRRYPNYYDNETVTAKLGYQFTDEFRINSLTRFINSKLLFSGDSNPITFAFLPGGVRNEADVQQLYTRNEAEWTPFVGFHNIFAINYTNLFNRQEQAIYDPFALRPLDSTGLGERLRYEYRGDYLISPGNVILFGAQRDEESLSARNPDARTNGGSAAVDARNGNTAGYVEAQLTPFDRAFLVANVRHDENDRFGPSTTYRVAPSYILPFTDTRIKGSVGTGFKAPSLSQLFQDFPAFNFFANPNLRPERVLGYDAGLEQPLGDRVVVGATYYRNDFRDLINSNATFTSVENVDRAESYGAEAFVKARLTDTLSGRIDYTNTVTKNEITNQELLRRPRHKGSGTLLWTPYPGLTFSSTLLVLSQFADIDRLTFARVKNPGFTIVNFAVDYQINETTTIFGRVDNLFDRRYESPTGFLGPGLAVYGGVRLSTF